MIKMEKIGISKKNLKERREKVREYAEKQQYACMIFFNSISIYYLTGYHFIPTERPIAFVMPTNGEEWFFVPRLEQEHLIEKHPEFGREVYFEYPDLKHPVKVFIESLEKRKLIGGTMALESASFPSYWGYEGPKITDFLKGKCDVEYISDYIRNMRKIKDEEEIELIKIAAKYGNLAHELLQKYTHEGANEVNVAIQASVEASKRMIKELVGFTPRSILPARAGYRGQIGIWSAIPHSVIENAIFHEGDVLVTGAGADVAGYQSELERTMFVGKPNEKQRRYFELMKKAQEIAIEMLKPGNTCSDVDKAVIKFYKESGISNLRLHHTGHAIGLEGHEAPFLDQGVNETIQPGMIFTCEPGIYEYKFGGFRHSDTVLVTEDGPEILTNYPRELENLIV